jgi:PleD family two-component response regulator
VRKLGSGPWRDRDRAAADRRRIRTRARGSAGVATAGDDDAEALTDRADRALYRAEARGRNCVDGITPGPLL